VRLRRRAKARERSRRTAAAALRRDERLCIRRVARKPRGLVELGVGRFGAVSDAHFLARKRYFTVLVVDELEPPKVDGASFTAGDLTGAIVVVDVDAAKPICHAAFSAKSSNDVAYGGGARVKVKGIAGPTIGDDSLEEAVRKDFTENVEKQMRAAMKRIGAR
jgi:hypothetical protein